MFSAVVYLCHTSIFFIQYYMDKPWPNDHFISVVHRVYFNFICNIIKFCVYVDGKLRGLHSCNSDLLAELKKSIHTEFKLSESCFCFCFSPLFKMSLVCPLGGSRNKVNRSMITQRAKMAQIRFYFSHTFQMCPRPR